MLGLFFILHFTYLGVCTHPTHPSAYGTGHTGTLVWDGSLGVARQTAFWFAVRDITADVVSPPYDWLLAGRLSISASVSVLLDRLGYCGGHYGPRASRVRTKRARRQCRWQFVGRPGYTFRGCFVWRATWKARQLVDSGTRSVPINANETRCTRNNRLRLYSVLSCTTEEYDQWYDCPLTCAILIYAESSSSIRLR